MRILTVAFFGALLCAALPLSARAAESFDIGLPGNQTAKVTLVEAGETARLKLEQKGAEPSFSEILGEEFQEFADGTKTVLFAAQDLDGDGTKEIIVRTTLPPHSGQLFAFRIEGGQLVPIKFGNEDQLEVTHGGSVALSKGAITFEEEGTVHPNRRTVRYNGRAFSAPSR